MAALRHSGFHPAERNQTAATVTAIAAAPNALRDCDSHRPIAAAAAAAIHTARRRHAARTDMPNAVHSIIAK